MTVLFAAGDKITAAKLNQMCKKAGADYLVYYNSTDAVYEALHGQSSSIDKSDADARTVIQYALDNDTVVLLYDGTYNLTGTGSSPAVLGVQLNEGNELYGTSKKGTILTQAASTNLNYLVTSTGKGAEDNVKIGNLTIDGNYSNQDYSGQAASAYTAAAISGYGDYWDIQNLIIKNSSQYGGITAHGAYYNIQNIYGTNMVTPAHSAGREKYASLIMLTSNLCYNTTVNNIRGYDIDGCLLFLEDYTFNNTATNLTLLTGGYGVLGEYAEWNEVSGFMFKDVTDGIQMAYSSVKNKFANGTINTASGYGVNVTAASSAYNTFNNIDVWTASTEAFNLASGSYAKASNCNVDGVFYSHGIPKEAYFDAGSGTEAYEYWKATTYRINADSDYADINFSVPADAGTISSVNVLWFAFAGVTDMLWNAACNYRAATQAANQHGTSADFTLTTLADKLYSTDVTSIFSSLAANDLASLKIARPSSGNTNAGIVGVVLKYTT